MKFTHWLNNTIIISRMATVSGDRLALSTVTSCGAQLQPLDGQKLQNVGGLFGKTFRIWVDSAQDIRAGDRIKDEDGNNYKVREGGVTSRSFGSIDYKEIIIELTE